MERSARERGTGIGRRSPQSLSRKICLGFRPVTYAEITTDPVFWDQCKACVNYPLLEAKGRKVCLCTAMVFDPRKMAI